MIRKLVGIVARRELLGPSLGLNWPLTINTTTAMIKIEETTKRT